MDDSGCHDFFVHPTPTLHRRDEALRAVFLDHRPWPRSRGDSVIAMARSAIWWLSSEPSVEPVGFPLFITPAYGRPKGPTLDHPTAQPDPQATADCHRLVLTPGRCLRTRVAGVFLFLPLLARLRFDDLVTQAGYPGSGMVPPPAALLSLLALKLLDKERRSHITDFNFDEALGLFAGLNVLPKKSYATDYSYRTTRSCQQALLSGWVAALAPCCSPTPRSSAWTSIPSPSGVNPKPPRTTTCPCGARPPPAS